MAPTRTKWSNDGDRLVGSQPRAGAMLRSPVLAHDAAAGEAPGHASWFGQGKARAQPSRPPGGPRRRPSADDFGHS
jgi:hypothetical protein